MELSTLRNAWLEAKAAETQANLRRLDIEAEILKHFTPPEDGEGTVSNKEQGVSVTYKITRSADTEALQDKWRQLPPIVQEAFTWKATPALKQLKALQLANPEAYAIASQFVTAKPAKPSISIKGETE